MTRTNAMRVLASRGIAFQILTYEWSEEHSGAVEAAALLGIEPERVFKTLVATGGPRAYAVYCIPANAVLDRKKAAAAAGWKAVELVPLRELHDLTGYHRGGCSPVGMKKPFPVFIDEIATALDWIVVNAGARGLQARIDPRDLARAVDGRFADLV